MSTTEEIKDIFSILHDGIITSWTGDKDLLTLTIDCQYLAENIEKSFSSFYVELRQVEDLFFSTWPKAIDAPAQNLTEPIDIFKAELELLSADIKNGKVVIGCNQHDTDFDYCGGNLTIRCKIVKVYDHNKNELTIDQLVGICKNYWDKWNKK